MIGGLANGMTSALGWVRESAGNVWSTVNDAFGDGIGGVTKLLIDWSPIGLLHTAFISALDMLGIEVPEGFRSLGTFIIDGLIGGVTEKLAALRERITSIATGMMDWFKGVLGIHSPSPCVCRVWRQYRRRHDQWHRQHGRRAERSSNGHGGQHRGLGTRRHGQRAGLIKQWCQPCYSAREGYRCRFRARHPRRRQSRHGKRRQSQPTA